MKTLHYLNNRGNALIYALLMAMALAPLFGGGFLIIAGILFLLSFVKMPKGLAFDSLVINDTSYSGTYAPYFILPATYGVDTVNKGCIFVQDGIKKQHTIGTIDYSRPWQPRVATPTQSGGNIIFDKRQLIPEDKMLYQEFNPRDFESHWEAEKLSTTLLTRELPPGVENYITTLIIQRAFEQNETGLWMSSSAYAGNVSTTDARYQIMYYDGLLLKLLSDAAVYQTTSPTTLTSSNIGAAMFDLYSAAAVNNKALLTNVNTYTRMKYLVSVNTALIYEEYLTTQPYKNNDTTEKGIMRYKGYPVERLAGLPDNTIVFTEALPQTDGNLFYGLNSVSDKNIQLQKTVNASELYFVKMLYKEDVNYGRADKVFMYTTLTTASFQP